MIGGHRGPRKGFATMGRKFRNRYAEGGAREARCVAKASSGETFSGRTACHATWRASWIRSRGADANVGTCTDWQTWQAVSGPPLCWWTKTPPAAKYNRAMQPNIASARLPEMSLTQFICRSLHTLV
jgi:hypothetical protein